MTGGGAGLEDWKILPKIEFEGGLANRGLGASTYFS